MKMVKSLLLGSAAGLAALTGAQAADLPVKAKPVEYVKICSLYGAGFYYIPGTDTCIRIGGHIRAEVNFNARGTMLQTHGSLAATATRTRTRDRDIFFTRSRVFTNVDTRTQTSFGTLRTFSVVRAELNTPTGLAASAGIVAIDCWHHPVGWLHDRPRWHVVLRQPLALRLQVGRRTAGSAIRIRQAVASLRPTRTSSATASPARCRWKTTRSASAAIFNGANAYALAAGARTGRRYPRRQHLA